jgi:hypothetical protein
MFCVKPVQAFVSGRSQQRVKTQYGTRCRSADAALIDKVDNVEALGQLDNQAVADRYTAVHTRCEIHIVRGDQGSEL